MRVLVVHSWGLGDLIMATPMLRSLHLSGHRVDLALFSSANTTVLKGNDFIDKIHLIRSKIDFVKFFKRYDALVTTAGTNPKKIASLNLLIQAKKVFASHQEKDIHRIDMNLNIVQDIAPKQIREPYIFVNDNEDILRKYLFTKRKNIAFCVGSGSKQKFKRWDGFWELATRLNNENILVFIGPDEVDLIKKYKNLDVKIVQESLEDTIKLIANVDLAIGNDNGLMHIAYATKRDTVTIYGMTNEKETGGYYPNNETVCLDMACRPCFDPATDYVGCATFDCLHNLSVENVWKACRKFL